MSAFFHNIILFTVLLAPGFVFASNSNVALSMMTFKRLSAIEALLQKEEFSRAQIQVDKLKTRITSLSPADQAYTRHMQALIFLYQQQYSQAQKYFLSSYQQPGLNNKTKLQVVEILASLAMHEGNYQHAIKFSEEYLRMVTDLENVKPSKTIYLTLASANYQLGDYVHSIAPLKQVIRMFKPDRSAYSTLFAAYYQLKQLPEATEIVEKMIRLWPEKGEYWLQLASIYLERDMVAKSLEIMQLSFSQGFLIRQNELLQYIYALYEKNLPNKAANLLELAMKKSIVTKNQEKYSLLATLYAHAKEDKNALLSYKKASELSATGIQDLYIAQIYFDQESYEKSIKHTKKALDKGIKKPGNAYMLIAAAYYELTDVAATKVHLHKAVNYKETERTAHKWLQSIGGG